MPLPIDHAEDLPVDQVRHFAIWYGGARVGSAVESETWSAAGLHLRRDETMRFLRGDAPVTIATTIDIATDRDLAPSRVTWVERSGRERRGEATRDPMRGWTVDVGGETLAIADPAAIPAELAPLIVRRRGGFAGPVFLPARGFVTGQGRIEHVAPDRLVARLAIANGPLALATIDLERDGTQARVVDGEGVIALRTTADAASAPFPLVDLVAASSIVVTGERPRGQVALALDTDPPLPALPGQRHLANGRVELSARFPGALPPGLLGADRGAEIIALVHAVRGRIAPDLGAGPTSSRDAIAATAGDCTTFALAYHALATERAIPTRVVTGLRLDGDHLVRHRWAVSWTGRAWIAVDVAFGEAPAGGELIGLAIHDADDAGLVAGEAALTRVHAASF